MSEALAAPVRSWLTAPMDHDVSEAIERLRRAPDVQQIAVMPDVHFASEVCIGVVVATTSLIYPQAVGGDIGCGMLAVGLDVDAKCLKNPKVAATVLAEIGRAVPARHRNRRMTVPLPDDLAKDALTHPSLESCRRNEGVLEFATLGSGNHFIEIQSDEDNRVWLMVHSGSRALGQAIRDHHFARAHTAGSRFRMLDAQTPEGIEYLHDASYARRFAEASRKAMATEIGRVLARTLQAQICWNTLVTTDHNHVSFEHHGAWDLWVHRKGAMPAKLGKTESCQVQWVLSVSTWRVAGARRYSVRARTVRAGP